MGESSVQMTSAETPLGPKLPLRLGRFTLCEELGAGGMATVYLARMGLAAGLERLVALKTIHPHLAKERPFVDMFLDEARIASHVTHPNVCSTHDFGEVDGVYYLAMEYLLGEPVFDVINAFAEKFDEVREVLPFLAARIIADACEGLNAAHIARGPDGDRLHIVHRDVSPQNLFLTYEGAVKVVDFGCAKATERVAHTSTGVMKGKVGYASPEQIKGQPVDARADVWALGVCLWEALTLSPLFSRDTAVSTAMAVLEEEIELASEGRDWVPEEVALIAQKALSRDPEGRYATSRDMSRALRKFIADSGYTLESAELAEWMDFLFEERHEERVRQTARVQELDISNVGQHPLYVSESEVELLDSLPAQPDDPPQAVHAEPEPEPRRVSISLPEEPSVHRPEKRGRGLLVALLVLVGLGVGGYYLQLYYEPAPWLLEVFGAPAGAEGSDGAAEGDAGVADVPEALADAEVASPDDASAPESDAGFDASAASGSSGRRRRRRGGGVTTVVSGGGSTYSGSGSGAPPAPRTETGILHIETSSGWAEIYEGGRRLGRTPLHQELPVGTHRIRVVPFGASEAAETITVHISENVGERLTLDVQAP